MSETSESSSDVRESHSNSNGESSNEICTSPTTEQMEITLDVSQDTQGIRTKEETKYQNGKKEKSTISTECETSDNKNGETPGTSMLKESVVSETTTKLKSETDSSSSETNGSSCGDLDSNSHKDSNDEPPTKKARMSSTEQMEITPEISEETPGTDIQHSPKVTECQSEEKTDSNPSTETSVPKELTTPEPSTQLESGTELSIEGRILSEKNESSSNDSESNSSNGEPPVKKPKTSPTEQIKVSQDAPEIDTKQPTIEVESHSGKKPESKLLPETSPEKIVYFPETSFSKAIKTQSSDKYESKSPTKLESCQESGTTQGTFLSVGMTAPETSTKPKIEMVSSEEERLIVDEPDEKMDTASLTTSEKMDTVSSASVDKDSESQSSDKEVSASTEVKSQQLASTSVESAETEDTVSQISSDKPETISYDAEAEGSTETSDEINTNIESSTNGRGGTSSTNESSPECAEPSPVVSAYGDDGPSDSTGRTQGARVIPSIVRIEGMSEVSLLPANSSDDTSSPAHVVPSLTLHALEDLYEETTDLFPRRSPAETVQTVPSVRPLGPSCDVETLPQVHSECVEEMETESEQSVSAAPVEFLPSVVTEQVQPLAELPLQVAHGSQVEPDQVQVMPSVSTDVPETVVQSPPGGSS